MCDMNPIKVWFIIVGIGLFVIVSSILILNWWFDSPNSAPKLKFSSFKKFYALNSARWDLYDEYVVCIVNSANSNTRMKETFRFGLIDFYRYKLWNRRLDKEHEKRLQNQSIARMIAAVKSDIEKSEKTAQQQYKTASNMIWKACNNTELMED